MKDELEYAMQAQQLATTKFEKFSKEYFEMKTKYEMQVEERLKFDELEKSKKEEVRKIEVISSDSY